MADFLQSLVSLLTGGANQSRATPMPAPAMPQGRPMVALPQTAPIPTERPATLPGGTFMPGREPTEPVMPVAAPSPEMTNPQNPLMQLLGGGGAGGDFRQMIRAAGAGMANLGNSGGDPFVSFGRGFGGASEYYTAKEQNEVKLAADRRREEIAERAQSLQERKAAADAKAGTSETGLAPQMMRNPDTGETIYVQPTRDGRLIKSNVPDGFIPYDPYAKALATGSGTAAGKARGEAQATYRSMSSKMPGLETVITKLDGLAKKATYTLAGQGLDAGMKQAGMEPREAAVARSEYIATVDNQILPLLRDTFGAAFTVKEGDTLRATLGDPDKTPAEKQVVLRAFIEQKRRDIEGLAAEAGISEISPSAGGVSGTGEGLSDPLGIR